MPHHFLLFFALFTGIYRDIIVLFQSDLCNYYWHGIPTLQNQNEDSLIK